jgi:5'-deoxynucleotidase YfbR-like HD superfamily hydrolase
MSTVRHGDWFCTRSGKRFYVFDPRAEDVCIEDIAHALSNICRFGGHPSSFYSVAQHSVLVARWLSDQGHPKDVVFWGLMHDSAEAFVGDMIWPMKRSEELSNFAVVEHRVMLVIAERFGMAMPEPTAVKQADLVLLATEKRDLMAPSSERRAGVGPEVTAARHAGRLPWSTDVSPMEERIVPLSPLEARAEFHDYFARLTGGGFA